MTETYFCCWLCLSSASTSGLTLLNISSLVYFGFHPRDLEWLACTRHVVPRACARSCIWMTQSQTHPVSIDQSTYNTPEELDELLIRECRRFGFLLYAQRYQRVPDCLAQLIPRVFSVARDVIPVRTVVHRLGIVQKRIGEDHEELRRIIDVDVRPGPMAVSQHAGTAARERNLSQDGEGNRVRVGDTGGGEGVGGAAVDR